MSPKYIKLRKDDERMPTIDEAFKNYLKVLNKEDRAMATDGHCRKTVGVYEVKYADK